MTVTKTGIGVWHSSLTDNDYDSLEAATHYDNLERMRSQPESDGEKLLAKLSTEELKSLTLAMNVQGDAAAGRLNYLQAQQDFVDTHPDYWACPQNGGALQAVLVERGKVTPQGAFLGTMQDFEDAYLDLSERNVLLRKKGTAAPKRPFDAAEAYAMPMTELERRGRGF